MSVINCELHQAFPSRGTRRGSPVGQHDVDKSNNTRCGAKGNTVTHRSYNIII